MKVYGHLPGYLHRWVVARLGRFMIRVHRILDIDRTPFLHSHPFHYVSIVLRGAYFERVLQKDGSLMLIRRYPGSIVFRRANTFHRIDAVLGPCTTLFFVWNLNRRWSLKRHNEVKASAEYMDAPDGVYQVEDGFRKRQDGMWFVKASSIDEALSTDKLSIHQHITKFKKEKV